MTVHNQINHKHFTNKCTVNITTAEKHQKSIRQLSAALHSLMAPFAFDIPLNTVQVISEIIFLANLLTGAKKVFITNYLAGTSKTKCNYSQTTTQKPTQHSLKTTNRCKTKLTPGSVRSPFYAIWPRNGLGLFYSSRGSHGALTFQKLTIN